MTWPHMHTAWWPNHTRTHMHTAWWPNHTCILPDDLTTPMHILPAIRLQTGHLACWSDYKRMAILLADLTTNTCTSCLLIWLQMHAHVACWPDYKHVILTADLTTNTHTHHLVCWPDYKHVIRLLTWLQTHTSCSVTCGLHMQQFRKLKGLSQRVGNSSPWSPQQGGQPCRLF